MSMPSLYSDRPLWVTLVISAALTPLGILFASQVTGVGEPLDAIYHGFLMANLVVVVGVLLVGVANDVVVFFERDTTPSEAPAVNTDFDASNLDVRYHGHDSSIVTAVSWERRERSTTASAMEDFAVTPEGRDEELNEASVMIGADDAE